MCIGDENSRNKDPWFEEIKTTILQVMSLK